MLENQKIRPAHVIGPLGEPLTLDHARPEAAFVIEHVMGDAQTVGDGLRVVDVLPGAAAAAALHRFTMIVKLQRDPDDLGAGLRG